MSEEQKNYTIKETGPYQVLQEPYPTYGSVSLYQLAAQAITKSYIKQILMLSRLSLTELIEIIPISIDTYKRKTEFGALVTEKVLEVEEVYRAGIGAFGDGFYAWMDTENVSLGGIKPKEMLSNSFGVRRLLDEIGRLEHGVLA